MSTKAIDIFIAYDVVTGQVYLNAAGETEEEAMKPILDGCFEVDSDLVKVVRAELRVNGTDEPNLFPAVLPVHRDTMKPCVKALGTTEEECRVNLDYDGLTDDDYIFIDAVIQTTAALDHDQAQSLLGSKSFR